MTIKIFILTVNTHVYINDEFMNFMTYSSTNRPLDHHFSLGDIIHPTACYICAFSIRIQTLKCKHLVRGWPWKVLQ